MTGAATVRRRTIDAMERYLGSDPGGERFRSGLSAVVAWLAAVGAAALLESITHGFEVSASAPGADAANHIQLLVVLMIGSTVSLTAGFVVTEKAARARAATSAMAALGLWAGIALAVWVHDSRVTSLILLAIVPSVGAWFRRYGPRGFASSFTVHVGYLIGFLVAPQIGTVRLGWVGAVIVVSSVVTYAVGLLFLPGHAQAPRRMRRSYRARVRRVLELTTQLMDTSPNDRAVRRRQEKLRRQVVRLNETALVLDVQLAGYQDAADEHIRGRLFQHERAVVAMARLAQVDAHHRGDAEIQAYARALVVAAGNFDTSAVLDLANRPTPLMTADSPTTSGPGFEAAGSDANPDKKIVERYREAARTLAVALQPEVMQPGRRLHMHPADS